MTDLSPQLVIFDCDGVLVDSELITNRVFAQMLNELGLKVSLDEMFEKFVGNSMSYCIDLITSLLGKAPPPTFLDDYHVRTKQALEKELRAVPGVEAALEAVRLPYCVASSGDHNKMRTTLGLTGLWPKFDGRVFSVTDVARGKPWPDVYLFAAERLGVAPNRCLVVEDSPVGVSAGVAAGMRVFGYAAFTPARRLRDAGAHLVFNDMRALPTLLSHSFAPATFAGLTSTEPSHEPHPPKCFYHGTRAALGLGDFIQPGYASNYGERRANWVYFSQTLNAAAWGAELAKGDMPHIYLVEPTGDVVDDPNLTDKKFPGNPTQSFRSREPLRIIAELLDWQGHSDEEIHAMKAAIVGHKPNDE